MAQTSGWNETIEEFLVTNDSTILEALSQHQLDRVATEFAYQGLELDFPIVCWGDDLDWTGSQWYLTRRGHANKAKDPRNLRVNSYRVMLSRGRDGFVVYVPLEAKMDAVAATLRTCGLTELMVEMVNCA